ncbi:MAG: cyclic nucleotide-binding domain-containing protein [Deltaproteobacteria bacterium]|nr:cyclic nucleotide-binding domain-containing protein [Deltaproteobacteria bacterium]
MLDLIERALALRSSKLFAPLPAEELLPVAELLSEVQLEPGDVLFSQGDSGDSLYVILEGRVRVSRGEKDVAELGPSECFGELAVLDWEPRSASVVAVTRSELLRLDRDDLLDLLGDSPDLVHSLARVLAARLRTKSA